MPRRFFRRVSAGYRLNQAERPWYLRPFRALLAHPMYFHVNRRSVAGACWVGLFLGLLPFPGQTLTALLVALLLRVNLPIAGVTVWISNPFTMVPIFYTEYRLGALILNLPLEEFQIEMTWHWVTHELLTVWKPLLLGASIAATVVSSLAYVTVSVIWRLTVAYRYKRRHATRVDASAQS